MSSLCQKTRILQRYYRVIKDTQTINRMIASAYVSGQFFYDKNERQKTKRIRADPLFTFAPDSMPMPNVDTRSTSSCQTFVRLSKLSARIQEKIFFDFENLPIGTFVMLSKAEQRMGEERGGAGPLPKQRGCTALFYNDTSGEHQLPSILLSNPTPCCRKNNAN